MMTVGKTARKTGNNNPQPNPTNSQRNERLSFGDLCQIVDEMCQNASEGGDDILTQIQNLLLDKGDHPNLAPNVVTAVSVTQLLLPVMGFANRTIDKRLCDQDQSIDKLKATVRVNVYERQA